MHKKGDNLKAVASLSQAAWYSPWGVEVLSNIPLQ